MEIIKISSINKISDISSIKKIAAAILEGKIVILPTSTVYGISCRYNDIKAIMKIYKIKQRNINIPFITLISNLDDLKTLTRSISHTAKNIINEFWKIENPESLTLIFNKSKNLKKLINSSESTIALRMAESRFLREIINISGPIISTSATISGTKKYPAKIGDIPLKIKNQVDLIVEYKFSLAGIESTIVNMCNGSPILVREGRVKFSDIIQRIKE
jgi:L-threonylcarbamoyladenylate synthase